MSKKILSYCIILLVGIFSNFIVAIKHDDTSSGGMMLSIELSKLTTFAAVSCGTSGADPATCIPTGGLENPANKSDSEQNQAVKDMYNKAVAFLNIVLAILTIIVSPAIMLAGWLMSPDWTSGDLFGIRPVIHNLWVTVSNITYFIYAILLIFIALATIFNSDNFGYKQLLPKLALGIILVPLSWWFIQFTISLSSLVTAAVMNIPAETLTAHINSKPNGANDWWNKPIIPSKIDYTNSVDTMKKQIEGSCNDGKTTCLTPKDVVTKSSGMYSSLLVYGYGVFKFSEVKEIDGAVDVLKSVTQLIHSGIISALMFIVFGLLVIALIFMLLVRAIKLWFYAIFSPLMTLKFVVGDRFFGKDSESFEVKEFIGLAFVPALVGLSLSFGLVIIALLQSGSMPNQTPCNPGDMAVGGKGCEIVSIMGNPENKIVKKVEKATTGDGNVMVNEVTFGGVTFRFVGSTKISDSNAANAASAVQSALSSAGGIFGTIIIDLIALIFIWVAFMAAKGVNKMVSAVLDPFEKMGKNVAGLAMSAPKYVPLPIPGGSIAGLGKAPTMIEDGIRMRSDQKFKDSDFGRRLSEFANASTPEVRSKMSSAVNASANKDAVRIMQEVATELKNAGKGAQMASKTNYDYLDAFLKRDFTEQHLKDNGITNPNDIRTILDMKGKPMTEENAYIFGAIFAGGKDIKTKTAAETYLKDSRNTSTAAQNNSSGGIFNVTQEGAVNQNGKYVFNISGGGIDQKTPIKVEVNKEGTASDFATAIKKIDAGLTKRISTEEQWRSILKEMIPGNTPEDQKKIDEIIKGIGELIKK